jgi:hypothetical protein
MLGTIVEGITSKNWKLKELHLKIESWRNYIKKLKVEGITSKNRKLKECKH